MHHVARLVWTRTRDDHDVKTYSRDHQITFYSGASIPASAATSSTKPSKTVGPGTIHAEEMVVAAATSCHMLIFLSLATMRGLIPDRYEDDAVGVLDEQDGVMFLTHITLRPRVTWHGDAPSAEVLAALHHEAHARSYIASSLRSEVRVLPG